MNRNATIAVSTLYLLLMAAIPREAAACMGACCIYPPSSWKVVGHVAGGFLVAATLAKCDDADGATPRDPLATIRKITSQSFVMLLGAQRRPFAYAETLASAEAYRADELLYWWSRPPRHAALLKGEREPALFGSGDLVTRKTRAGEALVTAAGDVLDTFGSADGCAFMTETKLVAGYTTPVHDYVLVHTHVRGISATSPYSQDHLSLVAKPDRLDVVIVDAMAPESGAARALLDAFIPRLQKAGLHSVKLKKATAKHTKSRFFVRAAEVTYPRTWFEDDWGGPPEPVNGAAYVRPGVRAVVNALLGEPRGAAHDIYMDTAPLDWDEPAHIVLVVTDDLPDLVEGLRKEIKACRED